MNSPGKQQLFGLGSPRRAIVSPNKTKKIDIQKNQLRVILNDYKKVKTKCESLLQDLGEQFTKKQFYDKLEKATIIKLEILDLQGIVELKNQLIRGKFLYTKALTELYHLEHEMVYKKQRNLLRYNSPQAPKARKRPQFPPQIQKFTLEVPIYNTRDEDNLIKVDRISSYLYDLRSNLFSQIQENMRRLSTAIFKNYETSDFLMNQPEYLQVKQKVERYRMRNEELVHLMEKKIEEQVQKFFLSCDTVEETDEYTVLKVYDSDVKDLGRWYELSQTREWDDGLIGGGDFRNFKVKRKSLIDTKSEKELRSMRLMKSATGKQNNDLRNSRSKDPHDTSAKKNLSSSRISKRSSKMSSQIQDDSEDKNNYVYMVHKFGPQNEKNSSIISSLSSLRSKRKKVFNDDIWDQFDKI